MKNKIVFIVIIFISLLSLNCRNRKESNQINVVNENKFYFHFEFRKLDTVQIVKCFGRTLANNLSVYPLSQLMDTYIVEIQNLGFDSMFIPCKYIREVPIYHSGQTKYFSSLSDTIPTSFDLPFDSPATNQVIILQNEKKYFLTSVILNESIAKIDYSFYSYMNNEKKISQIKVILTKHNGELIDMTRY